MPVVTSSRISRLRAISETMAFSVIILLPHGRLCKKEIYCPDKKGKGWKEEESEEEIKEGRKAAVSQSYI